MADTVLDRLEHTDPLTLHEQAYKEMVDALLDYEKSLNLPERILWDTITPSLPSISGTPSPVPQT